MFIVLEGPDGSGKTTLGKALTQSLECLGLQVLYTFEPTTNSEYAYEIRKMLKNDRSCDPIHISDLLTADRGFHLESIILPALAEGKWVVCDRYKYSALAYQQMQGIDAEYLIRSNQKYLIPDAVFILIPRETSTLLERIGQRNGQIEYFEKEHFLNGTMEFYNKMTDFYPEENIYFLDAERSVYELIEKIKEYLHRDGFL